MDHLKRREQRTQDRGHRIVDCVDERHEDCERRPAEDARLADYVRHSRIMNGGRRSVKPRAMIANDGSLTDLIEGLSLLPWPLQDLRVGGCEGSPLVIT